MNKLKLYQPIIIKAKRFVDVLIRSNEEQDFYLDLFTGAFILIDLHADEDEMNKILSFVQSDLNRFFLVPKQTEYEKRKIIEDFVHDKVNDIEFSEKILQEIDSLGYEDKFIEIMLEYPNEYDKWILFYSEHMRIVAIEWVNSVISQSEYDIMYVLEEDLTGFADFEDVVSLKESFDVEQPNSKITKLRKEIIDLASIYKQEEIMKPKPKRGRPPKNQQNKTEQVIDTGDFYIMYDPIIRQFIYYDHTISDVENNPMALPDDIIVRTSESAIAQAKKSAGFQ